MTLAAAVGAYTKARDHLRTMLANSTTFQTWTDSDDATEALTHVHLSAMPPPASGEVFTIEELVELVPGIVLWTEQFTSQADSAPGIDTAYRRSGQLCFDMIGAVDEETQDSPGECGRIFDNVIGGLINDLETLNGTAGYLAWNSLRLQQEPVRSRLEELPTKGDLFRVRVFIDWQGQ